MPQKLLIVLPRVRVRGFQRRMLAWFAQSGNRDFIWRTSPTPYRVLVAEVMLQQTQVSRVEPKYRQFLRQYPNVRALARANTRELLTLWSGLGYNRRALHLRECARKIVRDHGGRIPEEVTQLRQLPGIGPYTASAINIFARNRDEVCVDTNIRRVLIFELGLSERLSAEGLKQVAGQILPHGKSRIWHCALMDYGRLVATSRATGVKSRSGKSEAYHGSRRYFRGKLLKLLLAHERISVSVLARQLGISVTAVQDIAAELQRDGLVVIERKTVRLVR